ncbi:hypothetical protein [Piscinibacter gummiphilus]|uniref:Uncharacterized protein n=1 Tax=Piscinibacter gummiphilus TaxID=946333 RepID=A0A1W6LH54_9BURK|nr:hypothetical protein [Piscinibacter gummiphilus]ARN23585.1 hypothetical protein A4W93_28855 [Piscinibacter gummiphilus]ATU68293.1 hypothetical protein CPZ87_28990 [Piscinibacter gummiphilus]GLS98182.1 hypothetical protein GCM10007918_54740 [Piscinibacter gummiphilus]
MRRRTQRGQALILIFLGTLLLGGAAGGAHGLFSAHQRHQLRKHIEATVTDPVRREALDFTLEAMEREARHRAAEQVALEKELFDAMARHDTAPAEFEQLTARADAGNAASNRTMLGLRFQLREQLTDTQWRSAFVPGTP